MRKFFSTLLITAMICAFVNLSAQVTIGSGSEPSEWSLLDLDNSERVHRGEQPKALHLPRLTYDERNALVAPVSDETPRRELERGLMIFNTSNFCLEYWNGIRWVSLCFGNESEKLYRTCPPTGVMIGNRCWARANVGAPGTFAANPEDPGMFFQWNRRTGWSVTNPKYSVPNGMTWNSIPDMSGTWISTNDPCPPGGWRIPTAAELESLGNGTQVWNEGRFFGTQPNQIFLPFSEHRDSNGSFVLGAHGRYWSSTVSTVNNNIWTLRIVNGGAVVSNNLADRNYGYAIRCVIYPIGND